MAPIGPETPLTRILEFMMDRLPLYQLVECANKLETDLNSLKGMKCQFLIGSCSRFSCSHVSSDHL